MSSKTDPSRRSFVFCFLDWESPPGTPEPRSSMTACRVWGGVFIGVSGSRDSDPFLIDRAGLAVSKVISLRDFSLSLPSSV